MYRADLFGNLMERALPAGLVGLVLMAGSSTVLAMQAMSETEMAGVTGQDGLTVQLSTPSIQADRLRLDMDDLANDPNACANCMDLETINFTGVGLDGANPGATNAVVTGNLDVGNNGVVPGSTAGVGLSAEWTRSRLQVGAVRHQATGESMGSVVMDSSGSFKLIGVNGILNTAASSMQGRLILNDGQIYYEQGGNELLWDNVNVDIGFDSGSLGAGPNGLEIRTPRLDWNILFDFAFRDSPGVAYTSTGNQPMFRYGWEGGLTDMEVDINPGGVWTGGNEGNRTEGLHISWRNNYSADFNWIIGDAGANATQLKFGGWTNFGGASYAMDVGHVTLDVIDNTADPTPIAFSSDALGITAGSTFDIPADAPAFATLFRDVGFHAYNTEVLLVDQPSPDTLYNWGLIYTLGDLDANIYLYPGGQVPGTEGIRFDALVALKSPGTWQQNSHFLIADTDTNLAVGFMNTDFLVEINDARLELVSGAVPGIKLSSTSGVRWRMDAEFGGGDLTNLGNAVRMADLALDLHAESIDLTFSPPPVGETYIGFDWSLRFAGDYSEALVPFNSTSSFDSFISLAEPSRPTVDFQLGQIRGDLAVENGKIDLRSAHDTLINPEGVPKLVFEQNLQFGITAGSEPIVINNVAVGANRLGSIAIPGGQWRGVFALKEQLP